MMFLCLLKIIDVVACSVFHWSNCCHRFYLLLITLPIRCVPYFSCVHFLLKIYFIFFCLLHSVLEQMLLCEQLNQEYMLLYVTVYLNVMFFLKMLSCLLHSTKKDKSQLHSAWKLFVKFCCKSCFAIIFYIKLFSAKCLSCLLHCTC